MGAVHHRTAPNCRLFVPLEVDAGSTQPSSRQDAAEGEAWAFSFSALLLLLHEVDQSINLAV